MEGVAGIPPTAQNGNGLHATLKCAFLGFQHKIRCAFPQIKTRPSRVKRPAGLLVQYHKGIEAVEMIGRETLAAPTHHTVELSASQQIGPIDDCICGR